MLIKAGRKEYDLTRDDNIMYNGNCYQIITRLTGNGWDATKPIISKARAEKLIKEGKLVFSHYSKGTIKTEIYKITDEE